jgi:hypothetical protein
MPLQEGQFKWILDTVKESNQQVIKLSSVLSGHSMALKILGGALIVLGTVFGTALVGLFLEVFKK